MRGFWRIATNSIAAGFVLVYRVSKKPEIIVNAFLIFVASAIYWIFADLFTLRLSGSWSPKDHWVLLNSITGTGLCIAAAMLMRLATFRLLPCRVPLTTS